MIPVWGGLIFGGAYARRGLSSEFYGNLLCVLRINTIMAT